MENIDLNNTPKGEETLGTPEIREVLKTVENNTAAPGEIAGTVTKETSENEVIEAENKSEVIEAEASEPATVILETEVQASPNVQANDEIIIHDDEDDEESEAPAEELLFDEVDHSTLSREELAERLSTLLKTVPITKLRDEVMHIKDAFEHLTEEKNESLHKQYLEEGGDEKDFITSADNIEQSFKHLIADYYRIRDEHYKKQEDEKQRNYDEKQAVIEELKALIDNDNPVDESIFNTFKALQNRWKSSGKVPQAKVRDLYNTYHHHLDRFYEKVKIFKELRDYDFKKNLEAKTEICEKAEALLQSNDTLKSFRELQDLHKEWREIGPVPREYKETIWERFKEATTEINKKHQEYYDTVKDLQQENLDKKTALCERAEAIAAEIYDKPKDWSIHSEAILETQKEWRTVGFAPKKYNTKVYERFRTACDLFFEHKRQFYAGYKSNQDSNYDEKVKLAELAESMKESTEWKKTTDEFIRIQKLWKEIGPVPRKQSDIVWKRFREACDFFFDNKSKHFKSQDKSYETNMRLKRELIERIDRFEPSDDNTANTAQLNAFREEWTSIGHVPFKEKDALYNAFRIAINKHYSKLNIEERERDFEKFKSKIGEMSNGANNANRMNSERNKLVIKLRQLETEISTYENNIGFFGKSKGATAMVKEFEKKIEQAKERLKALEDKIKLIDKMDE